jgi:hypothetical protein
MTIHPAEPMLPDKFVLRDERGNVLREGSNPLVFDTRAEAEEVLRWFLEGSEG